jgi:hypothetical protein
MNHDPEAGLTTMSHLPLPVRVAVGLVATALEQARKLPEQLADLPVTAASQVVQVGMRIQQQVTQLAIKGDEVFSRLRPVEDTAPWARFDEDEKPSPTPAGATVTATPQRDTVEESTGQGTAPVTEQPAPADEPPIPESPVPAAAGEMGDEADAPRIPPAPGSPTGNAKSAPSPATPAALPGYDELSLTQLRAKLRELSLPALIELLDYERSHQDRPAFVTLLSNRISTVRSHPTDLP